MDAEIIGACKEFDQSIVPKTKQLECFKHFINGKDVIANLPVGYGKSLLYQALPNVYKRFAAANTQILQPVVLVISPLNIIQMDQVKALKQHNVNALMLPFGSTDTGDDELKKIEEGKYKIVFAHPEAILNSPLGGKLLTSQAFVNRVIALVVDECHIVEVWGEEFRTAFAKIKTLPAVFDGTPMLALSGTLTPPLIAKIPKILGMDDPALVQESPDKPNVFIQKIEKLKSLDTMEVYEKIFFEECNNLKKDPHTFPVTLMFMPLFYMSQAAAYLKHLFGNVDITSSCYAVLYSRQDKCVLETTVADLKSENPRIRLVLTTSVAGMGYDPPSVTRVIHAKPPHSLTQYMQEIGRAGRRGQNATAILYFGNKDIAKNVPGIQQDIVEYCRNNTMCLRSMLLGVFGFSKDQDIPKENCCSYCAT